MDLTKLFKPLPDKILDININAEADHISFCSHYFVGAMQNNFLVLLLVQGQRVVYFAAFLDKNLVDLELNGLTLDDSLLHGICSDQTVDINILALADSVCTIHCLQVHLRVEVRVIKDNMICRH